MKCVVHPLWLFIVCICICTLCIVPSDKDAMPFLKELSIAPLPNLTSFTFYNLPEQISAITMFCRPNIPKLSTITLFPKDNTPIVSKPVEVSIPKAVTEETELKSQQMVAPSPVVLPPQDIGQSVPSTVAIDSSTEIPKIRTDLLAVSKVDPKTLQHIQTSCGYIVTSINFGSMNRVIVSLNGLYMFYCYIANKKSSTIKSQLKEVDLFNWYHILDGHNLWSEAAENEIQI